MVERPYQYVPTLGLIVLIEKYKIFVEAGDFKFQKDLQQMKDELDFRFCTDLSNTHKNQISIEEYMRSRKNECNRKRD